MANSYLIVTKDLSIEHVIVQLNAITTFPATLNIYDRVITLHSVDEHWIFQHAIEAGFFMGQDYSESTREKAV